MLKDPRRLYAPGRLYHIVERKPFRYEKHYLSSSSKKLVQLGVGSSLGDVMMHYLLDRKLLVSA